MSKAAKIARSTDSGVELRPRKPRGTRFQPVGLGATVVHPKEEVTLETCVCDRTEVRDFFIESNRLRSLVVTDLVFHDECFLPCGPLPATVFDRRAPRLKFDYPTVEDGHTVSVTVKNLSGKPAHVCAGFRGKTPFY
jgi:hypothetical protein